MFSKNTKFRFQNILIFILFMFIIGAIAIGETIYEQNTESSIGDMTSETVATTPANRSRTTIGIGEEVVCRIDSNSWADTDCEKVDDGPWTEVNDTIGDRVWACSSGGTINPSGVTSSNTTTLTADKSPDICVVGVDVYDSEDKFDDDAIWKSITFDIIAPDGQNTAFKADHKSGEDPNGTRVGAYSTFDATVTPTTVSFYNAELGENIPFQTDNWPSGPNTTWGPYNGRSGDPDYNAMCDISVGYDNMWVDHRDKRNIQRSQLDGLNGLHVINRIFQMEYQNESGNWITFYDGLTSKYTYANDANHNDQAFHTMAGSSGDASGGWMGPFK